MENKYIYLSFKQYSQIDDLLDEDLEESYCKNITKNLKDLFQIYVYSDIAQNPPEIKDYPNYHHEKINITKALDSISTKDRKFYEFYQDIEIILGKVKDLHLNVVAKVTPMRTSFEDYYAYLPFNFKIKKYNTDFRIFIEGNDFKMSFGKKVYDFIINNSDYPIKNINGIDAFDYIQNWSKFRQIKNLHAQFKLRMNQVSFFSLKYHPLNYSDMSLNDYEFENGEVLKIPYKIWVRKKDNIEFENYLLNKIKSIGPVKSMPNPDIIYQKFLSFKGIKNKNNNNNIKQIIEKSIEWDPILSHIEDNKAIKCRVDKINKANVIYQNSFSFKDNREVMGKMLKCVKLFLENDYPVIIIESNNGGGSIDLFSVLLQILQPRIEIKEYSSFRVTSISEKYFKKFGFSRYIDQYDCHEINGYNDFKYFIEDNYDDYYGTLKIHHKRTSAFDPVGINYRLALNEFREEIKNNTNLKRPTDIIIFTDSYSFSATSGFIKGFQNTGGAVTVGFYGNPKIKGTALFDNSQSCSAVEELEDTQIKEELKNNGFIINGVTISEFYNFHRHNVKNQIPREYSLDPVDFRVDIYSDYSDELYDQFVQEGLRIHKQLNQEYKCNSKNDKLLLHDEKCNKIDGDVHGFGGYKCGKSNTWDKSKCYTYFCDIGYYFDQKLKKCIKNCNFNEKNYFIYEDNFKKIYDIKADVNYNFIFLFSRTRKYIYQYQYPNYFGYPRPIHDYLLNIGKRDNDIKFIITELTTNISLLYFLNMNSKHFMIKSTESLIFLENSNDYILYLDNIYKSSLTKIQLAEYNERMTYEEILNHDEKYFYDIKGNILTLSGYKMYFLYINFVDLDPFNIFVGPINNVETIEINNYEPEFLYLEKNNIYTLYFRKNIINRMMKLSRETLRAEIKILNKDFILNSENLYYPIDDNYKDELILKVEKDNALIEFLFKQDYNDMEVLYFEKKIFTLNKKYNILPIPKKYSSKLIEIELRRNDFLTKLSISLGYTIPPYNFFSADINENIFEMDEKFTFTLNEHYKGGFNMMDGESYSVMIKNFGKNVLMLIKIKDDNEILGPSGDKMNIGTKKEYPRQKES